MTRLSWREILLVLVIVALGTGWYVHQQRLSKEFGILSERIGKLEVMSKKEADVSRLLSNGDKTTSLHGPDKVTPFQTLYLGERKDKRP